MRVLWLCNIMIPKIANDLHLKSNVYGGWLSGAIEPLLKDKNNVVKYLFPFNTYISGHIDNLEYESFYSKSITHVDTNLITSFEKILQNFKPDIVHVWGSEFPYSLCLVNACENVDILKKVVVSIQGLICKCADAYSIGLPSKVKNSKTIRDIIKFDSISKQQKMFYTRGEFEKQLLKKVHNVIGRTDWDKQTTLEINHNINYYFCDENLRKDFYNSKKWDINSCDKYRIFCSQVNYPIKGFHFALQALKILKQKYPKIKLYVTGKNYVNINFLQRQKLPYYFTYLRKIILKNNLQDNIVFLGQLNSTQMIEQYLKAHIFLSPSTIENSSNSIGEAMLIGTPVVSSNVGGCPTMVDNNKNGLLYNLQDINEMANCIEKIFLDNKLAISLSKNAIIKSTERHNCEKNYNQMIQIYNNIINNERN